MLEQLETIAARLADLEAAVSKIVAQHKADNAALAAAQDALAQSFAVKTDLDAIAERITATVSALNAA